MAKKMCKDKDKVGPIKGKNMKFFCRSCGEEASKEKHLCKPKKK